MNKPLYEILGTYIDLVNKWGKDSEEARAYYNKYSHNEEFVSLVKVCEELRKMFGNSQKSSGL